MVEESGITALFHAWFQVLIGIAIIIVVTLSILQNEKNIHFRYYLLFENLALSILYSLHLGLMQVLVSKVPVAVLDSLWFVL